MAEPAATVLLLADYGGPYRGSFIASVQALGVELRERGWHLECGFSSVARDRPWVATLVEDGVTVQFAPAGGRAQLEAWTRERLGAIRGPVVLHTHFTGFDLAAVAAARSRSDAAVIWHVHSYLSSQPRRVAAAMVKYGLVGRRVARIVCAGEAPARAVRRRGAAARTVTVLPNGIDTAVFGPVASSEREQARAELGLPAGAPVLLHFAWDWPVKGGPLFAETLARLRSDGVPAVGVSVGGGGDAAAAAERLGLGDALRAPAPREDVRRFYAAADMLLAASRAEGGEPTFSILEALGSGLAVVGTDIPGHRLKPPAPRALRVGPAEPGALAELARLALQAGEPARAAEAQEASAWVAARRDVRSWAREMTAIYERSQAR